MVSKNSAFGKKIKKRLIDKEMTYSELANIVGTSPQYIGHIVRGYRAGKKYLNKINEVLELNEEKVDMSSKRQ